MIGLDMSLSASRSAIADRRGSWTSVPGRVHVIDGDGRRRPAASAKRLPPARGDAAGRFAAGGSVLDALAAGTRGRPGLDLLVLFGSRARGAARPGADWDFGYLAAPETDVPALLAALVDVLRDDRVDLVDLGRAGGLLRYRAACDGRLVHEASAGRFDGYRLEAARFWCENAPIFEAGYDEVLKSLRP